MPDEDRNAFRTSEERSEDGPHDHKRGKSIMFVETFTIFLVYRDFIKRILLIKSNASENT